MRLRPNRAGTILLPVMLLTVTLAPSRIPAGAQTTGTAERVVARAGGVFISEREFIERFELLPALQRNQRSRLEEAKREFLYGLVAEKLLAQEAVERGLDRTPAFRSSLLTIQKLLARDQLYREEILGSVVISQAEIDEERRRASLQALCDYLFFERETDARVVASTLHSAADFDRLSIDSSLAAERDTATVIWGEADPAVEEAAYRLQPGEVSPPVRAGSGWYILRLRSFSPSGILGGLSEAQAGEKLTLRIRERKEDALMHAFLARILEAGKAYARPAPFRALAVAMTGVYRNEALRTGDSLITLSAQLADSVRARCGATIAETLVVAGDEAWSVGDVIDRLHSRRFSVRRDRYDDLPAVLNGELEYLAQQEVVAQEALRRGLADRPEVRQRVGLWRDAMLADLMKSYARSSVTVTDTELDGYLRSLDGSVAVPQVKIRELRTRSLAEMEQALGELSAGAAFPDVVVRWSVDEAARARGGETPLFAVTERPPLGEMAASMKPGERAGPVSTADGPVFFELLERIDPAGASGGASAGVRPDAREELLALTQQGVLNRFLARSASQRGVDVYLERLKGLQVTPIPMLTYRILGFGGRMFEVPFVDPQIQWLNVEPPDTPVIP